MEQTVSIQLGTRRLDLTTGVLAPQAGASVQVRFGDTVVLATACVGKEPRPGIDFLPLTCDFEERLYAAGRIPGNYFRREGRPSQEAILTSRLIDRPLRPLFPKGFRCDVQITVLTLSADQDNPPDVLGMLAASAALHLSDAPFLGPIGAVRVGIVNDEFVVNPTYDELKESTLDLVIAGTADRVVMVEAGGRMVLEDELLQAISFAQEAIREQIQLQNLLREQSGKPKRAAEPGADHADLKNRVEALLREPLKARLAEGRFSDAIVEELKEIAVQTFTGEVPPPDLPSEALIRQVSDQVIKHAVRERILGEGLRPDGRRLTEIRPLRSAVGLLPRTHGSGLFQRGLTQVLTSATLGAPSEARNVESVGPEGVQRYMHHYNMPPFASGECRPLRSPGRREVGHGALAERALRPVLPSENDFPYTIRLVSEVLSSNGSTSMASVCGSTLALMDAGVPISAPVGGIAMGLITDGNARVAVLTDIQGIEDHLGDMDFKVAGTETGVTALQLDVKIPGIPVGVLDAALMQARDARLAILAHMGTTIAQPRPQTSRWAPHLLRQTIDPGKIGKLIGPGGKTIRSLEESTKTTISIKEDGSLFIAAPTVESAERAWAEISGLVRDVQAGDEFVGPVVRIIPAGAFIALIPGKDGLLPAGQADGLRVGDRVSVVIRGVDLQGRVSLQRKDVPPIPPPSPRPTGDGKDASPRSSGSGPNSSPAGHRQWRPRRAKPTNRPSSEHSSR